VVCFNLKITCLAPILFEWEIRDLDIGEDGKQQKTWKRIICGKKQNEEN